MNNEEFRRQLRELAGLADKYCDLVALCTRDGMPSWQDAHQYIDDLMRARRATQGRLLVVPDAPLHVNDLPDYWDARRRAQGKPDPSQCAAELRRALADKGPQQP